MKNIWICGPGVELEGIATFSEAGKGTVIFAHGSGSSRFSPRNRQTAAALGARGLNTLLFDLLSPQEATSRENIFNIPLLASRLQLAARWVRKQEESSHAPYGFLGASTGAGAALWAAAELGQEVSAVVSRGGRPDLAAPRLPEVAAPTLLIVGGQDTAVLALNRRALSGLRNGELQVIPGAGHLFEEEGALTQVEELAAFWFLGHFQAKGAARAA